MENIVRYQVAQRVPQYFKNCLDCHSICWKTIKRCLQLENMYLEGSVLNDISELASPNVGDEYILDSSEFYGSICKTCAKAATEAFKIKRGLG